MRSKQKPRKVEHDMFSAYKMVAGGPSERERELYCTCGCLVDGHEDFGNGKCHGCNLCEKFSMKRDKP